MVMREQDVLDVLAKLTDANLAAWVDGGWGVDALLGVTTREHDDLDLVVRLSEIEPVRQVLAQAGFSTVVRDWLPNALALTDETGRSVDLHPVTTSPDGGGDQQTLDGRQFHYPPPVPGVIAGRPVRCVDAVTQLVCHSGYEPRDKDRRDVAHLRRRFAWTDHSDRYGKPPDQLRRATHDLAEGSASRRRWIRRWTRRIHNRATNSSMAMVARRRISAEFTGSSSVSIP